MPEPYVDIVEPDEATGRVREVYDEILDTREGEMAEEMSLNRMWMAFAAAPYLLETFWDHMRTAYRGGTLPFELKSKVSLVTATVWDCEGCRLFHTDRLEREGVDDDEIEQLRQARIEDSGLSEVEFEVLRFTEKAATDAHDVTAEDVDRLRAAGLSDAEIVELVDCIAVHVYTAIFQESLGVVEEDMDEAEYLGSASP